MRTATIDASPGFWGNVDPKVKKGLVIGGAILVFGGTTYYFANKAWKKRRANKVLKSALHEGTLASVVEKINVAIAGAGTDEEKVYEAFSDIPTQTQTDRVATLYKQAYDETLDDALRGDLDTDELQTVKNITSSKPKLKEGKVNYDLLDDWVRRLKASSGTWSTDEDGIYRVLWEVPDKNGYTVLSTAVGKSDAGYKTLTDYLNGQLGDDELEHARYIMARKT